MSDLREKIEDILHLHFHGSVVSQCAFPQWHTEIWQPHNRYRNILDAILALPEIRDNIAWANDLRKLMAENNRLNRALQDVSDWQKKECDYKAEVERLKRQVRTLHGIIVEHHNISYAREFLGENCSIINCVNYWKKRMEEE